MYRRMPLQSQARVGPEPERGRRAERSMSGRAQRKAAEERSERRKRLGLLGSAVGVALLIALILILMNRPQAAPEIAAAQPLPASIPVDGRSLGNPNATVTLVEWGDYACPHCGDFARTDEPQLISDFVTSGRIRFEFRDYAFLGPDAVRAAEAAACAADQNAFWRFHDTLYLNQGNTEAFSDAGLKEMARTLGLDTAAFNSCLDSAAKEQEVTQSLAEGQSQGVNSTPSFFINGTKVPWEGWDALKQALDTALAQG
jgi:protein-disulfide isomerase